MSLAGITQHCKIVYSQSGQALADSAGNDHGSWSLRKWGAVGLGISQSHLLGAKLGAALAQLAGSAPDNRIAEHGYHHHEKEVAGVHEVQVY